MVNVKNMNANIFTTKVTENGRITIPKYYREKEGIRDGDIVVCHIGKVKTVLGDKAK